MSTSRIRVSIPFKREGLSERFIARKHFGIENQVSIPFKRESLSEHAKMQNDNNSLIRMFQFPSNGKVFPNSRKVTGFELTIWTVSIPFKREGLSELRKNETRRGTLDDVSIPFKREGLSEL